MDPTYDDLAGAMDAAHAFSLRHVANLGEWRAATSFAPLPALTLAEDGPGAVGALGELFERYGDSFSGNPGPRYWGFVNGGVTPAALAGDWLCSALDQNSQMNGDGPAVCIEAETIGMLRDLFGLPADYSGNFVTGGTMANYTCLAIAVQTLGARKGVSVSEEGISALGPTRILSGESHASIAKAAAMLGLGRSSVEALPLVSGTESVDVTALDCRLAELSGQSVIVVGNAGTVNTGSFDNLVALADAAEAHGAHFHVDGAFGIFARCSDKHRHLLDGLERADTITADAHKWLNVPYDSGFIFTRHIEHQMAMFKSISPYLLPPVLDHRNLQHLSPENSRRLRALPAWVTLRAYGRGGYREIVERCVALAKMLGTRIEQEPGFRLFAPVNFNVVCFQLLDSAGNPVNREENQAFIERVKQRGRLFITGSTLWGQPCIRVAFVNWRTQVDDIAIAIEAMRACRFPADS
jgi:glutamate/tyrosine decarboxylase-like PLP-dependent enzyme